METHGISVEGHLVALSHTFKYVFIVLMCYFVISASQVDKESLDFKLVYIPMYIRLLLCYYSPK